MLQPVGGLLTAIAVAVLGFWTSSYLRAREGREAALRERMQTSDTNARLYSELTSKREESDSALRKDMFTSIINSFLREGPATLEQKMLNLELLVYNFHESLNLKPLFMHIERGIGRRPAVGGVSEQAPPGGRRGDQEADARDPGRGSRPSTRRSTPRRSPFLRRTGRARPSRGTSPWTASGAM